MKIKIKANCRADGKHYILVEATHTDAGCTLRAIDKTQTEVIDSVVLLDFAHYPATPAPNVAQYVLVIPQLDATQYVEFLEFSGEGEQLASTTRTFAAEALKWQSRYNYKFNKDIVQIRGYDINRGADAAQFSGFYLTSVTDWEIARFTLVMPARYNGKIEIKCYTKDYKAIGQPAILLDDTQTVGKEIAREGIRHIFASVKIPSLRSEYIFQAYNDDTPVPGFYVLDGNALATARANGNGCIWNASNNNTWHNIFAVRKASGIELARQRAHTFPVNPKFSIVVPVFNTDLELFNLMVASVLEQTYGTFELILVNASPQNAALSARIADICAYDSRVKCVDAPENLGISDNTNKGIAAATGDFVCFLDHDDALEPDALFEFARAVNDDPDCDLIYSDEDNITEQGYHCYPKLKPPFAFDYLRSVNYICHFLAIRASLLKKIGPLDPSMDGAQDYDLILRAVEQTSHIAHVPRVLYHWRMTQNSTANDINAKPYAKAAGVRALQNHLDRSGIAGVAGDAHFPTTYKIDYIMPAPEPLVSIIIPNKDAGAMLTNCIDSIIQKSTYSNFEIIVVDNNSTDPQTPAVYDALEARDGRVKVVHFSGGFNFSAIVNFGVAQAKGDYLLLLNNDTEVITPNWITQMMGYALQERVGAVGVKLIYRDHIIQHAGVAVVNPCATHINIFLPDEQDGYQFSAALPQDFSAVTGACLLTRRDVWDRVGGFDETLVVAFNDVDFCLKVRHAGQDVVMDPQIVLFHDESVSRGYEKSPEKLARFNKEKHYLKEKWPDYFTKGDPAINPNFLKEGYFRNNFSIEA